VSEVQQIDGIDVFVDGEGTDTLVMIHGWPDTHRLWDAQVEAMKSRYRCVRFTLPGFDIAKPRRACSLDELADIFRHVVEQTSPGRKVILMLHDWGCVFGYHFAKRHPSLVDKIVGVDIGDGGSRRHVRSLSIRQNLMVFSYQAWLAIAWCIGGRLGDRMTRATVRLLRCPTDPQTIRSQMNYPYFIQWTGTHGSYRGAGEFVPRCPMLYIHGTRKPLMFHSQAWADQLATRADSQVLAFDTGHWVMIEQPQKFNAAVLAWLARGRMQESHLPPEEALPWI
jgi:pimeloyl-ACP methyl ester carboxylesterase